MPKVRLEYRQPEEPANGAEIEAAQWNDTARLNAAVAQEIAERALLDPQRETLSLDQNIEAPPLPPEPPIAPCEPETKEQQIARAEARIKALFAEATAGAPVADDDSSSRLRREAIAQLVAEGWKHTAAIKVGDRVQALLDSEDEYTYQEALLIARDDVEATGGALPATKDEEPEMDEEPVFVEPSTLNSRPPTSDEMAQILHNFERDTARLRKLLGMEGVKKTRRAREGKSG